VANYRTNTKRHGNHLVLNGTKTLISRAEEAGMFVVFTRVDGKAGREGIGCVLVEKGTPGLAVTGTYHTMGGENGVGPSVEGQIRCTECNREFGFRIHGWFQKTCVYAEFIILLHLRIKFNMAKRYAARVIIL
jgi:nicotinamidase-related amidase